MNNNDFGPLEIDDALCRMTLNERRRLAYALDQFLCEGDGICRTAGERDLNGAITDMISVRTAKRET